MQTASTAIFHSRGSALAVVFALGLGAASFVEGARADVYYFKDAAGIFHFSSTPEPNYVPLEASARPGRPLAAAGPDAARHLLSPGIAPLTGLPGETAYDRLILQYAERNAVDPALVKAVIRAESHFRPEARSPKGASGLMQLMPRTARAYGVGDIFDPRENVSAGVRHLRRLLDRFGGNLEHAIAAYNAGSPAVRRHKGVPPFEQTRRYVQQVLRYYKEYRAAFVARRPAITEARLERAMVP